MNEEEFEELFGNTPFENIKKIQDYIDKNYIPVQKVKDNIEKLKHFLYTKDCVCLSRKIKKFNDIENNSSLHINR